MWHALAAATAAAVAHNMGHLAIFGCWYEYGVLCVLCIQLLLSSATVQMHSARHTDRQNDTTCAYFFSYILCIYAWWTYCTHLLCTLEELHTQHVHIFSSCTHSVCNVPFQCNTNFYLFIWMYRFAYVCMYITRAHEAHNDASYTIWKCNENTMDPFGLASLVACRKKKHEYIRAFGLRAPKRRSIDESVPVYIWV